MQKSKVKSQKSDGEPNIEPSVTTQTLPATSARSTIKKSTSKVSEPTTMEELFSQTGYQLKSWQRRDMVEATILSIGSKQVLLDIGGKSEAVIHEKEIPYIEDLLRELKVGDRVTTYVTNSENDRGQIVVSLRKTAMSKRWEILAQKVKSEQKVEVTIRELSRGGFLVDFMGLRGFIPLSQIDPEFVRLGERAAGRRIPVRVIEVDQGTNRLVFSQSVHGVPSEKHQEALKQIEIGAVYTAEVTGIAPFGAFVTVKVGEIALPGLIHISEIAWEKVESPSDYIKVGQTISVKAIGADQKTGRLTFSLKQLTADPWEDVAKVLGVDQIIKGTVSRVSQYGVFVSVLPGIEGLIHISKLAPGEEPKAGQEIECMIESVDPGKKKISLSLVSHAKPIGYR